MKSYEQLCAVARALDIVGDRWNLLIVRELLIAPRMRFTDVQRGLPGIAPNLLVTRLRELETHGVVRREAAIPPAAGTVYALSERGAQLEGVVRELLRWGAAEVADAPADASFQMHWLSMPVRYLSRDNDPTAPPVTVRFGNVRDGFDVIAAEGATTVEQCGPDRTPDAVVEGPGAVLVGLVQGALGLTQAVGSGVVVEGDEAALRRILPSAR